MHALERLTLSDAAKVLGVPEPETDAAFNGVSIDSRNLRSGNLFIALHGPHFDGHDYIAQVAEKDAAGAVVSHALSADIPLLQVNDTHQALARLAKARREAFRGKVIAITGSNGKTTVKEMLAAILSRVGIVLATQGNLNNEIGLPLTLLRLEPGDDFAVVEMGANHAGEIARLTDIARPDIALITNAGAAHLEGFGSLDGVARAKGEIFSTLTEDSVAVVNLDDSYAEFWQGLAGDAQLLSFAVNNPAAQVRAKEISAGSVGARFILSTAEGDCDVQLGLYGAHNVSNALAAATVALAMDVPLLDIKLALEAFTPVNGRLKTKQGLKNAIIIDDSYNANPDSFKAAIDVLSALPGQRILVMGEMREVGDDSTLLHRDVGRYAREKGIDMLFAIGETAQQACLSFGPGAEYFSSHESCGEAVKTLLSPQANILIKGSRGAHMERIVNTLVVDVAETKPGSVSRSQSSRS